MKKVFLILVLIQIYSCEYCEDYETSKIRNEENIKLLESSNKSFFYTDLKWLTYLKYCEYNIYDRDYLFYCHPHPYLINKNDLYNCNLFFGECDLMLTKCDINYSNKISSVKFINNNNDLYDVESYNKSDTLISLSFSSFVLPARVDFSLVYKSGDTQYAIKKQDYILSDSSKPYGSYNYEIRYSKKGFRYPVDMENICNIVAFDTFYNPSQYTQCGKKEFIESHRYILNEWFVKEAERRKYISADSTAEWKQWIYRKYYQVTRKGIQWIPDEWLFKWNDFEKCIVHDWVHFWYDPKGILFENGFFYCHTCEYFKRGHGANN